MTYTKEQARALQQSLNSKGANLKVDGIVGSKTKAAMQKYGTATGSSGRASATNSSTRLTNMDSRRPYSTSYVGNAGVRTSGGNAVSTIVSPAKTTLKTTPFTVGPASIDWRKDLPDEGYEEAKKKATAGATALKTTGAVNTGSTTQGTSGVFGGWNIAQLTGANKDPVPVDPRTKKTSPSASTTKTTGSGNASKLTQGTGGIGGWDISQWTKGNDDPVSVEPKGSGGTSSTKKPESLPALNVIVPPTEKELKDLVAASRFTSDQKAHLERTLDMHDAELNAGVEEQLARTGMDVRTELRKNRETEAEVRRLLETDSLDPMSKARYEKALAMDDPKLTAAMLAAMREQGVGQLDKDVMARVAAESTESKMGGYNGKSDYTRLLEKQAAIDDLSKTIQDMPAWEKTSALGSSGSGRYNDALKQKEQLEREIDKLKYTTDEYWENQSDDEFDKMKKEAWIARRHPVQGAYALSAAKTAITRTDQIYGTQADGTEGNAFKHAYWSALMTNDIGEDAAKMFADAHEVMPASKHTDVRYEYTEAQHTEMDLFFNELGRKVALDLKKQYAGLTRTDSYQAAILDGILAQRVAQEVAKHMDKVLIH